MQYRDKTTNETVTLTPSKTDFLLVEKAEGEGLRAGLSQKLFSVTRSANADRVLILRARNEQESAVALDQAIDKLRADPEFESVTPGLVDATGHTRFALPNRVLVKVRNSGTQARRAIKRAGGRIEREYRASKLLDVRLPDGADLEAFIETMNALDDVILAEPTFYAVDDQDMQVRATIGGREAESIDGVPAAAPLPWHLQIIDLAGAWALTRGRQDVVVAIVDGTPDTTHESIADKFLGPLDDSVYFSADRTLSSHATNIAGIVAGEGGQITGIAPGVRLLPFVVDLSSQLYAERVEALAVAAELARSREWNGVPFSRMVASCSWRTSGDIASIRTAIGELVEAGVVPIFSAGNDDWDGAHYPSDYAGSAGALGAALVSVAATQRDDRKAEYSNYSAAVTLCAPGGDGLPLDDRDIYCADQGGAYAWAAGTSIAVPHVAAVAALMLSVNANLTPADVKRLLRNASEDISANNPGFDGTLGSGRINARRAVMAAAALAPQGPEPDSRPAEPSDDQPVPDVPPEPAEPAGGGPVVVVETAVAPAALALVRERVTALNGDLAALGGWSVATATLARGSERITTDI